MLVILDGDSPFSIHDQIVSSIKAAMASGRILAGDQLPSVREMAGALNVNPNTIAKAYRTLDLEGLIDTRPGASASAAANAGERCRAACTDMTLQVLRLAKRHATEAGLQWESLLNSLGSD